MAKMSRDKGARGEMETVEAFTSRGFKARRSLSQSRNKRGDQFHKTEPDIILEEVGEVWIENKRMKVPSPLAALRQARNDSKVAEVVGVPMAICRADKQRATVTLGLDDFLDIFFVPVYGTRKIAAMTFQPPPEVDTDD